MSGDLVQALPPEVEALAVRAGAAFGRSRKAGEAAIRAYMEAGEALAEARGRVAHGGWGAVLEAAGIPARTASRMIRLARSGLKSATVADLGGPGAADRLLPALADCEKPELMAQAIAGIVETCNRAIDLAELVLPTFERRANALMAADPPAETRDLARMIETGEDWQALLKAASEADMPAVRLAAKRIRAGLPELTGGGRVH